MQTARYCVHLCIIMIFCIYEQGLQKQCNYNIFFLNMQYKYLPMLKGNENQLTGESHPIALEFQGYLPIHSETGNMKLKVARNAQ